MTIVCRAGKGIRTEAITAIAKEEREMAITNSHPEATEYEVRRDGPGGCPVIHGFDPLRHEEVNLPGHYSAVSREEAPVFYVPEADIYITTRHADVRRALTDHEYFEPILGVNSVPEEARAMLPDGFVHERPNFLPTTNPPRHNAMRKLAQKAFSRPAALAKEPEIRALCNRLVDEFEADGEAELVQAYTSRFPIRVMAIVMGVDEAESAQLYDWAVDSLRLFGDHAISAEDMMAICRRQKEWEEWALAQIEDRRSKPLDEADVISALVHARSEDGESKLADTEIFGMIVTMVIGGADTSSATAAQMLWRMLSNDDLLDRVQGDRSLLPNFLEEELRHDFVGRMTFRKVTENGADLGGVALPPGAMLGVHMWAANHDESVFDDPTRFDLERSNVNQLLSWGKGTHFCLGAPLARVEIVTAVEVVLDRLHGLELADTAELERMPAFFLPSIMGGLQVRWQPGD
jgi:cytochrome P450